MGIVYNEIERQDVVNALKKKGYGEFGTRRYALALNKPTGERWQSGGEKRVFAGGVSQEQLTSILRHSEDAEQAANQIEAVILGQETLPMEGPRAPNVPTVSLELVEKIVSNRVASEVSKQLAGIYGEIQKLAQKVEDSIPKPKKVGRPLGSKNKPKDEPAAG